MLYLSVIINAIPAIYFLSFGLGVVGMFLGYSEKVSQPYTFPIAALIVVGASVAILFTGHKGWLEKLLRIFWFSARRASQREMQRLGPLLSELCTKAQMKEPEVFIAPSLTINAAAFGKHTLYLNKGALEQLDDVELKGLLAHELGHLKLSHAVVTLKRAAIQSFTDLCIIPIVRGFALLQSTCAYFLSIPVLGWVALLFMVFFAVGLLMFSLLLLPFAILDRKILPLFFLKQARQHEYEADSFAVHLAGYEAVNNLLERLDKEAGEREGNFFQRLLLTHPPTQYRLDQIDGLKNRVAA